VYQVRESDDDLWATVSLPMAVTSAEGQQVEYLVLDTDGALAEPAVESYLKRLQEERDAEGAALGRAAGADNAKAEGPDSSGGAVEGEDAWALEPTLLKRMAAVRDAERGVIVQVGCRGVCSRGRRAVADACCASWVAWRGQRCVMRLHICWQVSAAALGLGHSAGARPGPLIRQPRPSC
jgi:hypothetical protein